MEALPGPDHGALSPFVPLGVRIVGEIASLGAVLGALAQALPAIATIMAIAWYAVMLFESHTIQGLWARRLRRTEVKVEKLADKVEALQAEKE